MKRSSIQAWRATGPLTPRSEPRHAQSYWLRLTPPQWLGFTPPLTPVSSTRTPVTLPVTVLGTVMVPGYGDAATVVPFWAPAGTLIAVVLDYALPEIEGVQPGCALNGPADDRNATALNAGTGEVA